MKEDLVNQTQEIAPYRVLQFYKFIYLTNADYISKKLIQFCKQNHLRCRILLGTEGINGTCSGLPENTEKFKVFLRSLTEFSDIIFKDQPAKKHLFPRISVRVRDEIVVLKSDDLNQENQATHLSPKEVDELVKQYGDEVVFFDMRNAIEYDVGHMKNAIKVPTQFFRDFPSIIDNFSHLKNKKVIMYCTGGIRCEKSSPLLKDAGFKEVYQIDGGVYNYCSKSPKGHWNGGVYVFDERINIAYDEEGKVIEEFPAQKIISQCAFCGVKTPRVVNDERVKRREQIVCCTRCDKKHDVSRVRHIRDVDFHKNRYLVGKGRNYYQKIAVGEAEIFDGTLQDGDIVEIEGPTSGKIKFVLESLKVEGKKRNYAFQGDIVTFKTNLQIRPSDKIYKLRP